jgi:hypothetical protein
VDTLTDRVAVPENAADTHCPGCDTTCPTTDDAADHLACRARHLYECAGWSTRRIAAACGVNRARLTGLLRAAGVRLAPRGAGRTRPHRVAEPAGFADVLAYLYVRERLSSTQIAEVLNVSDRLVRLRLAEYGIQRRTKGHYNREDRARLTPEQRHDLAVVRDLPATDISRATDTGYLPVLRDLHTTGLPVRRGGSPARIELLAALYEDDQIRDSLDAHGIPVVPPGGQLWERFPVPVALSGELLRDLYVDCGLSTSHIELLTGQPTATVRHHLVRHGIPRRAPGGRSPFLRRWRADRNGGSAR